MCLTVPGRVVRVEVAEGSDLRGVVDFGGRERTVSLLYTPEARAGDYVVVHAGFASRIVPEVEAREAIELTRQLAEAAARPDPTATPRATGTA